MKKILLIVALTLMSVIAFGQKGYEKIGRDTVGVLIKDPINGTFVANGMEKIRNALLGSIGKNFEKMTPLQQKNYLNTEEGKRKLTTLEKERKKLFTTTWCFAVALENSKNRAYYDLDYKRMMLRLGTTMGKETLLIGGNQFKFKDEYLYVSRNSYNSLQFNVYFLGLPCLEKVAAEIESNAYNLLLYVYFKVPNMNAVTNFQDMKRFDSMPNLSVKVDKIELKNSKTNKTYIVVE